MVIIFSIICGVLLSATPVESGSFTIDLDNNTFVKDGEPFVYLSGSFHYARTHFLYWEDRIVKAKAAGLDAIQTYIPWNVHEKVPGQYDFTGQSDIGAFFKLAQKHDMLVILRAGPYICGEWEFGGFPPWLLKENGSIVVRTMDPGYIKYVDRWFNVLLPKVKPYLYVNGGPVIMVQIENEYGSYFACDHIYMAHLRDMTRSLLGDDVILFTTDGNAASFLKCGAVPGVYATVDFGPGNMTAGFAPMRVYNPKGPLVNSEFYTGWLDYWGGKHATGDTTRVVNSIIDGMNIKANINMYMFEGGTNFGFMNGADPTYNVCPTSYDYDAPLTEAGDITVKYMAIRKAMQKFKTITEPVPPNTPKAAYGSVAMTMVDTVIHALPKIGPASPIKADFPLSMEQCDQNYGFIVYRHTLTKNYPSSLLSVPGLRDRGYVMLDGLPVGLLDRNGVTALNTFGRKGQKLDILVENQGRINFGSSIVGQRKGILGNVTFGSGNLTGWEMYPIHDERFLSNLVSKDTTLRFSPKKEQSSSMNQLPLQPALYKGTLIVAQNPPQDTFLDPTGWGKGQFYVNNNNVGRYWPDKGPQVTLYIPRYFLKTGANDLIMLELESPPQSPQKSLPQSLQLSSAPLQVKFVSTPVLNATTYGEVSGESKRFKEKNRWMKNLDLKTVELN